jgi:WD40 repeat protein
MKPQSGELLQTLEGHTDRMEALAFSRDGALLASKANDHTVRLSRRDTWELVAVIPEPANAGWWLPALTFHPTEPLLATSGSVYQVLHDKKTLETFSARMFRTKTDRLILFEIACRPGDCGHVPIYEHALGLNLYAESLRGQAGNTRPPLSLMENPRCMGGFAWFPPAKASSDRSPTRVRSPVFSAIR